MKKTLIILSALSLLRQGYGGQAAPTVYLAPSNPPPVIELLWKASPAANVTNYNVYEGTNSGQYTVKTPVGTNLSLVVSNLTRGQTNYYNLTCQNSLGLESGYAGETNYVPQIPPAPPAGWQPSAVLQAQASPTLGGPWANVATLWSPPSGSQFYRLAIGPP